MISLKEIKQPKNLNKKHHSLILGVLGSLITINEHIKDTKSLFWNLEWEHKVLDKSFANWIKDVKKTKFALKTKAMAEYLMWDSVTIELLWTWIRNSNFESDRTNLIIKHYIYPFFEDKSTISDNILTIGWLDTSFRLILLLTEKALT